MSIDAARARALDRISGADGVIVGAAMDHRDALRGLLAARGLEHVTREDVVRLKLRVCRALAPLATVVLIDQESGAEQALLDGALPGTTALAMPLEAQGYGALHEVAETTLLPDFGPPAARRLGAAAAKLLLPYRVDAPGQAVRQEAVVQRVVAACRTVGLALILEPIVYTRPDERRSADEFAELVIEGARRLGALDPDVLKLQHPGSAEACRLLDAAVPRHIPWVLLGGGATADALLGQVEEACRAGASGFVVGRTLFDAAVLDDEAASERVLAEESRPLLERLAALARRTATPWRVRAGSLAPVG